MRPFNRTIEKVLAWIANTLLILLTLFLVYISFFGVLDRVVNDERVLLEINRLLMEKNLPGIEALDVPDIIEAGFKVYAIVYIIVTFIVVVASFIMKSRILSGVLFLISAIVVGVSSTGVFLPIYGLHFAVAIMLFVRKGEEHINQNPYENNGSNNYNTQEGQYNQNFDGVNYKASSQEKDKVDKIEYL